MQQSLRDIFRADLYLEPDSQEGRALPSQDGAPWDGGGDLTPWPDAPTVAKVREA